MVLKTSFVSMCGKGIKGGMNLYKGWRNTRLLKNGAQAGKVGMDLVKSSAPEIETVAVTSTGAGLVSVSRFASFMKWTGRIAGVISIIVGLAGGFYEVFISSLFEAIRAGINNAFLLSTTHFLYRKPINLVGYSLGSLTALHTAYDLSYYKQYNRIWDVCLMGSVITHQELYDKLPRLIGSEGSVNGRIFVLYHENDFILKWILSRVQTSVAIGCQRLDYAQMTKTFREIEGGLDPSINDNELEIYLRKRVINVDVKDVFGIDKASGPLEVHNSYPEMVGMLLDKIGFSGPTRISFH